MTFQHSEIRQLLDEVNWPDSTFRKMSAGMADEDWDVLFLAIRTRLENCINIPAYASPEHSTHNPLVATQLIVRECVHALAALHAALQQSRHEYF